MEAMLPVDGHVHTEWSWDCEPGDMEATCARASALGLPAVAFTEHLDFTVWTRVAPAPDAPAKVTDLITEDGALVPPPLDVEGYLACVQRCRDRFPGLLILTGVEVGEPHWHRDQVAAVLGAGQFDRVLGSLHTLPLGDGLNEPIEHFACRPFPEVVRWWREAGGEVITFGSDAPSPAYVGSGFGEAVAMVEALGFRPGRHPYDRWHT